jgi:hypothetical protein
MALRHLETSLHRILQSPIKDVQKVYYELSGPFDYLKRHLRKFFQVALFDARNEEYEHS